MEYVFGCRKPELTLGQKFVERTTTLLQKRQDAIEKIIPYLIEDLNAYILAESNNDPKRKHFSMNLKETLLSEKSTCHRAFVAACGKTKVEPYEDELAFLASQLMDYGSEQDIYVQFHCNSGHLIVDFTDTVKRTDHRLKNANANTE